MMYDMHAHTNNSHDAKQSIDELCEAAVRKGLTGIVVTDHADLSEYCDERLGRIKSSVRQAKEAAEKYKGRLNVLVGVELSETFECKEEERIVKGLSEYDVILSSCHYVKYFEDCFEAPYSAITRFADASEKELEGFLAVYFEHIADIAENGDFDVLSHLTCPLRYINGRYKRNVREEDHEEEIRRILKAVISRDLALEVNTSGLGKEFGKTLPGESVLSWYYEMGGRRITLGGDSHVSENVANHFSEAIEMLKRIGFDSLCYFEKRKCREYPI